MTDAHPTGEPHPGRTADQVLAALDAELSRAERLRYLAVLVASFAVTGAVAALWATEPDLPLRTHLAFASIVAMGVGWMAVSGYVLTRRRPLYAADRVLATGMAVAATTVVGSAATVLAALRGSPVHGLAAGGVAVALVTAATALHVAARRRRRALLARRAELERAS